MVTETPNAAATHDRPTSARIAVMSFPEDDDLPDRRVVVYICAPTRH